MCSLVLLISDVLAMIRLLRRGARNSRHTNQPAAEPNPRSSSNQTPHGVPSSAESRSDVDCGSVGALWLASLVSVSTAEDLLRACLPPPRHSHRCSGFFSCTT